MFNYAMPNLGMPNVPTAQKTKGNDLFRKTIRDRIMSTIRDQIRFVLEAPEQNDEMIDLVHQLSGLMLEVQRRITLTSDNAMFMPPARQGFNVAESSYEGGSSLVYGGGIGGVETFGAKLVRELIEIVPSILQKQSETPAALVRAIAEAKEHGLTDIAQNLEQKLIGPVIKIKLEDVVGNGITVAPEDVAQENGSAGVVAQENGSVQ